MSRLFKPPWDVLTKQQRDTRLAATLRDMRATGRSAATHKRRKFTGMGGLAALLLLTGLTAPGLASPHHQAPSIQALLDSPGRDLPFEPLLAAVTCPSERGPVKEGSDADRFKVSTTVYKESLTYMRARTKPSSYPRNNRVTFTELHIYQVTAYLTQYKQEPDGDIHLVLKDASGHSMIAEMPYALCVPTASRWKLAIASARSVLTHTFSVTTSWHYVHRLVDIRGLGFMDPLHGQTGVAPNGVELHPVVYVHFH
jgi:hypothetical protein